MSSAAYMTDISKSKQCGPNQTAPDLDPLSLPSTNSLVINVSTIFAADNNLALKVSIIV